jgi:hypothetical protein
MNDVPEFSISSLVIHTASRDRGRLTEQVIERGSHLGKQLFIQAHPALPRGWIVVTSVYKLASQRRVG